MKMKNNIQDELEDISPFLSKHKKSSIQGQSALPEDYFSSFEGRLMDRINQENIDAYKADIPKKGLIMSLMSSRYVSLAAAWLLGVVIAWQFIAETTTVSDQEFHSSSLLAELSVVETVSYLADNSEDLDLAEITAVVNDDVIDQIQTEKMNNLELGINTANSSTNNDAEENSTAPATETAINKAINKTKAEDLLEDLTEDELDSYELF